MSKIEPIFKFNAEVYDATKQEFSVPDVAGCKDAFKKIYDNVDKSLKDESIDILVRAELAKTFSKQSEKALKLVASEKKDLRDKHLGSVNKELDDLATFIKENKAELQETFDQTMLVNGQGTIFQVPAAFTVETGKIIDPAQVQAVVDFLTSLGISATIKQNHKVLTPGKDNNFSLEANKKAAAKDKDSEDNSNEEIPDDAKFA